jgi:pyruvate/2-oxoglutarate dehydrogenase complex dihydrolipoamide acyltransferase (E2) component
MIHQYPHARVLPYAKYRRFTAAAYQSVRHRQLIHGLFEVDVTRPRAMLHAYKVRTGESLSFTAFLAACLARAVDEHKEVQAFRKGASRLVLFDDVDMYTIIEHTLAGEKYITPYIIRRANRKSVSAIHHEIRAAQAADVTNVVRQSPLRFLPTMLFTPFFWGFTWVGRRDPRLWKHFGGTVGISAVGMFGAGAGWGIPTGMPTALSLTVGGISSKPVATSGQIASREYLSLTLTVDHDIVDGAPAARFTERLKELIESGYGLDNLRVESEPAPDSPQQVNYVHNTLE